MKNKFILILALSLSMLSCTQEIEPRDADLGTESAVEDVEKAYDDALDGISIGNANIGQYVSYVDNAQVEKSEVRKLREISHRLTDIKESDQAVNFVLFEDRFNFDYASGKLTDEKHSELVIPFKKGPSTQAFLKSATTDKLKSMIFKSSNLADQTCDGQDVTDSDGRVYDCIKYFNLSSENRRIPPPTAVKNKPGCKGLQDCLMNVRYLHFDEVKWKNGKSVFTVTVTIEVAPEVPHLAYELSEDGRISWMPPVNSYCRKYPETSGSTTYQVSICSFLSDFQ